MKKAEQILGTIKVDEVKSHPLLKDLDKAAKIIDKVRRGKTKIPDELIIGDFRDAAETLRDYIEEMLDYVSDIK